MKHGDYCTSSVSDSVDSIDHDANENRPSTSSSVSTAHSESHSHTSATDELDDFLRTSLLAKSTSSSKPKTVDFRSVLNAYYENESFPGSKLDLFSYWIEKKKVYPQIYSVAKIILSAPATQNSVERVFSHVRFTYSETRSSLDPGVLNDVILLRLNSHS